MKNTMALISIGIIILVAAIFMIGGSGNAAVTGNIINSKTNIQIVKLSVVNGNYVMNPSELKKGVPVRLEADMTKMPGCSRSIVISSFNVRKTFTSEDNTVEFTPDKSGTFTIACSMNMYRGSFTVLENDGSKPNYVEQTPSGSGSSGETGCGISEEGCGCGTSCSGSGGCGCGG